MSRLGHLDLAILHVLRVDKQDVVDERKMLEQHGTDQAVEVASSDKTKFCWQIGHGWISSDRTVSYRAIGKNWAKTVTSALRQFAQRDSRERPCQPGRPVDGDTAASEVDSVGGLGGEVLRRERTATLHVGRELRPGSSPAPSR